MYDIPQKNGSANILDFWWLYLGDGLLRYLPFFPVSSKSSVLNTGSFLQEDKTDLIKWKKWKKRWLITVEKYVRAVTTLGQVLFFFLIWTISFAFEVLACWLPGMGMEPLIRKPQLPYGWGFKQERQKMLCSGGRWHSQGSKTPSLSCLSQNRLGREPMHCRVPASWTLKRHPQPWAREPS